MEIKNQNLIKKLAWEEVRKKMTPMVVEEYKNPSTYPTRINVMLTGEGLFLDLTKTTADAANFITISLLTNVKL